jgi:hypothetical protein
MISNVKQTNKQTNKQEYKQINGLFYYIIRLFPLQGTDESRPSFKV